MWYTINQGVIMKKLKLFWILPMIMFIVAIVTSIIAFNYSSRLEQGYLYQNDDSIEITYEGEYFAVLSGLGEEAYDIQATSFADYLLISVYDLEGMIIKEYEVIIKISGDNYNPQIITTLLTTDRIVIDDLDDYLFRVELNSNYTYDFQVMKTANNVDEEMANIILVNIPEQLFNMKNLNESISFTTLVFGIISALTILALYYIRKERD
jgi:hypothetical protein